jgi:WXG100 family type VII secretion target
MADLRVTPELLQHGSAEFEAAAQQMRDGLGSLDTEVGQLLGPSWTGAAATAYDAAWREWHEGSSKVLQGLMTMSELLSSAAARYSDADQAGGATIAESGS